MSLTTLPDELTLHIAAYLDANTLAQLARTCKVLGTIIQPIVFETLDLRRAKDINGFLFLAYTLITKRHLASRVRTLTIPPLTWAPEQRDGWPPRPNLDTVLNDEVAAALGKNNAKDVRECFLSVRNGTREDLIAALILRNTKYTTKLIIEAIGPRHDDSFTRAMFQRTIPSLTRLSDVQFGDEPREALLSNDPDEGIEFSYAVLVDLFQLPALEKLRIFAIGPRDTEAYPEEEWHKAFDFLTSIKPNSSLKFLQISEQLASPNAHLGHILKQCEALESLDIMTATESTTEFYDWSDIWEVRSFQRALACSPSLRTLVLRDTLTNETIVEDNQRSELELWNLSHLKELWLDQDWVFDYPAKKMDGDALQYEKNKKRLASMIPQSLEKLTLQLEMVDETELSVMHRTIKDLIQKSGEHGHFPHLSTIEIQLVQFPGSEKPPRAYNAICDLANESRLNVHITGHSDAEINAPWL